MRPTDPIGQRIGQDVDCAERVKLFKLAWDALGSEFASRHVQYEIFYVGAAFVTRGHSCRTFHTAIRECRQWYHLEMRDHRTIFLLLNLALAFYNVGTIWAHEIDIFRSWKLIEYGSFHEIQRVHWRKLVYWIFIPVGLALIGGIALVWYHPVHSPVWAIWGALLCQVASLALTAVFWGRWQAKLSRDPLGSRSPYLAKILKTHWLRTLLVNTYAAILLAWTIIVT